MLREIEAAGEIVPTGVGVNRSSCGETCRRRDCPHGRGGEPGGLAGKAAKNALSPRAWG